MIDRCEECYEETGKFCTEDCIDHFLKEEKRKIRNFIKKNPKYKKKLNKFYKKLLKLE